jgi:hypothetical protein
VQQAIAIAAATGLAAAFLFGVLAPGPVLLAPLLLVAPTPLMIAGLGWHPLVAALGGLVGALAISFAIGSKTALSFALLVGLPAYLVSAGLIWLARSMPANTSAQRVGRVVAIYVLGGIAAYAAIAMLGGALAVSTDYAIYEGRLLAVFQRMMGEFGAGSSAQLDPATANRMAQLFLRIFLPMSAIIVAASLIISLWLALQYLRRSERQPFLSLPAYAVSFPRDVLFWLAGAVGIAQLPGFVGLFGASFAGALLLLLLLNGLALIHAKTLGMGMRTPVLWAVWMSLLFFAPAALIYSFVGLLDALFDFRRIGDTPPTV